MRRKFPWRLTIQQLAEHELDAIIRFEPGARAEAWKELSDREARVRHWRYVVLPQIEAERSGHQL